MVHIVKARSSDPELSGTIEGNKRALQELSVTPNAPSACPRDVDKRGPRICGREPTDPRTTLDMTAESMKRQSRGTCHSAYGCSAEQLIGADKGEGRGLTNERHKSHANCSHMPPLSKAHGNLQYLVSPSALLFRLYYPSS